MPRRLVSSWYGSVLSPEHLAAIRAARDLQHKIVAQLEATFPPHVLNTLPRSDRDAVRAFIWQCRKAEFASATTFSDYRLRPDHVPTYSEE